MKQPATIKAKDFHLYEDAVMRGDVEATHNGRNIIQIAERLLPAPFPYMVWYTFDDYDNADDDDVITLTWKQPAPPASTEALFVTIEGGLHEHNDYADGQTAYHNYRKSGLEALAQLRQRVADLEAERDAACRDRDNLLKGYALREKHTKQS